MLTDNQHAEPPPFQTLSRSMRRAFLLSMLHTIYSVIKSACIQTWFERANGLHIYFLMQACCIRNGMRSICVGCRWVVKWRQNFRWVVKWRQNFRVHKSLHLALATPFEVLRNIMVNDGTDLTAGMDKNDQNGFTTTLDFPKIEVVLNLLKPLFFYTSQKCKTGRAD